MGEKTTGRTKQAKKSILESQKVPSACCMSSLYGRWSLDRNWNSSDRLVSKLVAPVFSLLTVQRQHFLLLGEQR